jgi:hypothetical protein
MHISQQRQEGWFPVIGVRFDKLSDLLCVFVTVCLLVALAALILMQGTRVIKKLASAFAMLVLGIVLHAVAFVIESTLFVYHTLLQIPWSWYVIVALTILPMAMDIPRQATLWFLIAYCVPNAWVVAYGIAPPKPKKETKALSAKPPPLLQPNTTTTSHLFTGLRISV